MTVFVYECNGIRAKEGSINPGKLTHIENQLPNAFEFNSHPFHLIKLKDERLAHSTACPHMVGPLGDTSAINGTVACPWHGYEFDVKTRNA